MREERAANKISQLFEVWKIYNLFLKMETSALGE